MKEYEVKFIKNGEEIACIVIDADNMAEARATALRLTYMDAGWLWDSDFKIEVAKKCKKGGE